ncbi:MAG TPA: AP2 domain-containing protein, partial [Blastocatellia bacterium]|nr:AP2 domain-containing protein [Blastocatellia bacterium]
PEKHNHGYYVRLSRRGKMESKFFADKSNGGKRAALRAARQYEAELAERAALGGKKREAKSVRNTSGKVGVSRSTSRSGDRVYEYWQASWNDSKGERRSAKFSVNKYGEEKARRMAVKARREGLLAKEPAT